jgi:hypothetical protein
MVPVPSFDKLRLRFRVLTSYRTVPVPSFDKLRLRFWFPNTEGGKIKVEGQNARIGQHDWFKLQDAREGCRSSTVSMRTM